MPRTVHFVKAKQYDLTFLLLSPKSSYAITIHTHKLKPPGSMNSVGNVL